MIKKLICLLNGHYWGEWVYMKLPDCYYITCKRCGKVDIQDPKEHFEDV